MRELNEQILACRSCPRLVACMANLPPRKGLNTADYWGRPVPGFGDLQAKFCLVGMAPGAHGANRTGRPFTGDGAGDFMYPLLHQAGFSNQAEAEHVDDGLTLKDLYITNAVKCLPPENRPNADEYTACRPFLGKELARLSQLRVIIALGLGAYKSVLSLLRNEQQIERYSDYPFAHGARYRLPNGRWLLACYHTSRYNVQTKRMTVTLFQELLEDAQQLVAGENG